MAKAKEPVPGEAVLKAAELKLINQGLYLLSQAVHQADQAERAGIDVSQFRESIDTTRAILDGLKQVYFPGQP